MSSGLPVVVNDDPSLHTAWTAGPGVRFVDMAAGRLRQSLEQLVADPARTRRLGEQARVHARRSFSWDAHVDRLVDVYRQVLG
jgi:glycosyltransferase involved in cell wall biosynthesis